jgi:elongation factor G
MDRDGASFAASISSLEKRLYINPLPIQLPVSSGKNFGQIVDLINMELMEWGM